MKGARGGLLFDIETMTKKTNKLFFSRCGRMLWVRLMGQLALHLRFFNESQKPLWARSMRPLRLPHLCLLAQTLVVFFLVWGGPSLATPLIGPLNGPAGTSFAFPLRIAEALVGQEHAPTATSTPLCPGPDPCVFFLILGRPVLGYASHWVWSPRFPSECSHDATHTSCGYSRRALLALGFRWPSCLPCPRP